MNVTRMIVEKYTALLDRPSECNPLTLDWDKMTKNGDVPYSLIDFIFDADKLTLDFQVELKYIGNSTSRSCLSQLGTNYMIDFIPFTTSDSVDKPNSNCSNKLSDSFINREWNEWWQYSTTPWIDGHIGSDQYLAYGKPSKYWTISYVDGNYDDNNKYLCGQIIYNGHFKLSDLINCRNKNGLSVIKIEQDDDNIYISGKLYVYIVSPIAPNLKQFYKVYGFDAKGFEIKISKSVDIVSTVSSVSVSSLSNNFIK